MAILTLSYMFNVNVSLIKFHRTITICLIFRSKKTGLIKYLRAQMFKQAVSVGALAAW